MTINNPGLYRDLSTAFQSGHAANAEVEAFFAGVRELREKHHIADVVLVAQVAFETANDDEKIALATCQMGNPAHAEMMHLYGAQLSRQEYGKALGVKP